MKAAEFHEPKKIRIVDVSVPRLARKDVLVRVGACSICGSDRFAYFHTPEKSRVIPGHEISGRIAEVGSEVSDLGTGQDVVIYAITHCGECAFCRQGLTQFCINRKAVGFDLDGGYAEYVRVPESSILQLPDGFSHVEGTLLLDMTGLPAFALKRIDVERHHTFAVYGAGNIGLGTILVIKAFGKKKIFAVDISERRLRAAEDLGAETIDAREKDPVEVIRSLTHGGGVDVAIDASGAPDAQSNTLDTAKIGGIALFLGENQMLQVNPSEQIVGRNISLIGNSYFPKDTFGDNLKLYMKERQGFMNTVSHKFFLDDIDQAFRLFFSGQTLRVAILP